jgi:hypothetical protein
LLDIGLEPRQRALLEHEATLHDGERGIGWLAVFAKAQLGLLYPDRVVVLLDNDIVVTGSLEPLVLAAEDGKIVAFDEPDPSRWFAEWDTLFSLRRPLREGRYANGACIALSTGIWCGFLERWLELGQNVAKARSARPFLLSREEVVIDPVGFNEQDTLNALLMSEVPEGALLSLPHQQAPHWADRDDVELVDVGTLRCRVGQSPTFFLHSTGIPKPWQPKGWLRRRFAAFDRLLTRVLTADDVPLRLRPLDVPPWLRPGMRGRALGAVGAAAALSAHAVMSLVPGGLRARVVTPLRARLSGTTAQE